MVIFNFKKLLEKNNMSRYRFQFLSNFDMRRINQFYFGTAKNIKTEEIDIICDIFERNISDFIKYKKSRN